jgi:predicted transcriptional regulator
MKKIFIMIVLFLSNLVAIDVGAVPKQVTLSGDEGGLVSGGAWDSSMIKDKVYVLFYVDPDEKDTNEAFADALKKENFDKSKYGSIAIVNLAATWKPNVIINALLKSKQKKFPQAIYVKDKNKKLVKEWALRDDSSDILVFDKDGKLLYTRAGKLDEMEIANVISLIKAHL